MMPTQVPVARARCCLRVLDDVMGETRLIELEREKTRF